MSANSGSKWLYSWMLVGQYDFEYGQQRIGGAAAVIADINLFQVEQLFDRLPIE